MSKNIFKLLLAAGLLTVAALSLCTGCTHSSHDGDFDKLLADYDHAFSTRGSRYADVESRIDSLRRQLAVAPQASDSISELCTLGKIYSNLSLDSALVFLDRAAEKASLTGNDSAWMATQIEKSSFLMRQGQDGEALLMYDSIPSDRLPVSLLPRYHYVGQQIGLTLFDRSTGHFSSGYFKHQARGHLVELLRLLPDTSAYYEMATASLYKLQGKESKQLSPLLSVIVNANAPAEVRANAEFWLAVYHLRHFGHDSERAGQFLLRAATEELRMGRKTGLAMMLLGQWFYNVGDHDRGFDAWRVALENSSTSSTANQWAQYNHLASATLREYDKNRWQSTRWITIMVVLVLVALAMAVLAWRARSRQKKDFVRMQKRLAEITGSKEQFVSQFLEMVSLYMEGIEKQNTMICRKIAAGRTEELVRSIRAGKFAADQNRLLISGFDKAFLNLYPTFIDDLNALLEPDRTFELPEPGTLSTEMRIMAMTRLGIDDATRVAHFLGVSVNTVYAYRNKVRTRALNRETFDADFMHIGTL